MSGNKPEPEATDKASLYNVNDGVFGRQGGPYGDEVDSRTAEFQAAAREGRDPNYQELQPQPGIQLVTAAQLVNGFNPELLAGDNRRQVDTAVQQVQAPEYGKTELPQTPVDAEKIDSTTPDAGKK